MSWDLGNEINFQPKHKTELAIVGLLSSDVGMNKRCSIEVEPWGERELQTEDICYRSAGGTSTNINN